MEDESTSTLPEVDRATIREAFETFNTEKRGEGQWDDWQSNGNHKYAIESEDRLYPVKEIVSLATGRPNQSFHTNQAISHLEEHGLNVVRLNEKELSAAIEEVFEIYPQIRQSEPFGKTDEDGQKRRIWELFEQIKEGLEESSVLSKRPHVRVSWSLGRGRWIQHPWIALLDERLTSTVKEGFCPSFSLRPEISELRVGYTIGLDRAKENYGTQVGNAILRNRVERLQRRSTQLQDAGFLIPDAGGAEGNDPIEQIVRKYYKKDARPTDEDLLADLDALLQTYDRHVSEGVDTFSEQIDRARLSTAVDNVVRPAIRERGDLEEGGREGYHHHKLIPQATPELTPDKLSENPREAVLNALRADVNLLSGNWQRSPAEEFFKRAEPEEIEQEVSNLFFGKEKLAERIGRFIQWGSEREIEDGKTAKLDGTVASYLLALSDPQEYAFCKSRLAYKPAVRALLTGDDVRSEWPERIAHARYFYRKVLEIFQEEHADLPFFDLMHVHIAFYLAENADEDAAWGEGTIEMNGKKPAGSQGRKAYKIAPGEGGKYWDDCREEGYICVGWGEVGSLDRFDSRDEFERAFRETFYPDTYDTEQKLSQKSAEVWTLKQLEPGDLIIANRGISEVLAVGEVTEPGYEWRPDREELLHTVSVDWDETYAQEIPSQEYWRFVTVYEISDDLLNHVLDRKGTSTGNSLRQSYEPPPFEKIYESVRGNGMVIDRRTLRRYHVSLRTRGFVILSGVSGTGKTWLTKLYAEAVKAKRHLEPVAPNWTTNEDLLGYYNPVDDEYHHTAVSRFLMRAEEAYQRSTDSGRRPPPYHLVLDEMNLARVEYYFAKFLSKMEERKREGSATLELGEGRDVLLPPNLSFIGTVNIDETTHAFADKVYDRAQLIEMEAPRGRLENHLGDKPYRDMLLDVWDAISEVSPFAFRVVDEIAEYVEEAQNHGSGWQEACDEQLLQKVLPKVKGTEPAVGEALKQFLEVAPAEDYPLSHAKANRMLENFRTHGFTSYFS